MQCVANMEHCSSDHDHCMARGDWLRNADLDLLRYDHVRFVRREFMSYGAVCF